jgi:hypothetical protein
MKPVGMQQLAETIRNVLAPSSSERRKNQRVAAPAGTFVISRTHPYARCSLVDIGISGLAFNHDMEAASGGSSDQLAIMTADGNIFISGIRCRTISEIPAESGGAYSLAGQTRRGVCFEGLTNHQTKLIAQFIQNHSLEIIH